ncbi:MAG: hotdog fold thioesterase [Bacteroidota bacterium]|jgi:acyl-CoA thioesterase
MENNNQLLAKKVVDTMLEKDWFSQWLGIEIVELKPGYVKLKIKIKKEMLNGFQIVHGGIYYSIADSALAFASNSYGIKSVSVETSISHLISCSEGEEIFAETEEIFSGNKIAVYTINILNKENKKVAVFKGTVYKTGKDWFPE